MDRILRHVGFLALLCVLALPACSQNPPASPEKAVRLTAIVTLKWFSAFEVMEMFGIPLDNKATAEKPVIVVSLRDFLPHVEIYPIGSDRLRITAESEDALVESCRVIALLDQPVKRVRIEAMLLSVTPAVFDMLMAPQGITIMAQADSCAKYVKKAVQDGNAVVLGSKREIIDNNRAGYLDFGAGTPVLRGILVDNLTVHPDNSVTIGWQFLQQAAPSDTDLVVGELKPPSEGMGEIRVKSGEGIALADKYGFAGVPTSGARTKSILLIMATVLDAPVGKPAK